MSGGGEAVQGEYYERQEGNDMAPRGSIIIGRIIAPSEQCNAMDD